MEIARNPFFSVIVPVYNTASFLNKCIESILAQTFQDFELILVDDCSDDGSGSICDSFSYEDKIRVIHHIKNQGVVKARDTGIKASNGRYILWVDSDDYILPDRFLRIFETIDKHRVDIVLTGNKIIGSHSEKNIHDSIPTGVYFDSEYEKVKRTFMQFNCKKVNRNVSPCLWTKAIKKELFAYSTDKIPFSLKIGDDAPRVYLAFLCAKSLAVIEDYSYCYVSHVSQMTRHIPNDYFENALWIYKFIEKVNHCEGFLPDEVIKLSINQNICHITAYAICISAAQSYSDCSSQYEKILSEKAVVAALNKKTIASQHIYYRVVLNMLCKKKFSILKILSFLFCMVMF